MYRILQQIAFVALIASGLLQSCGKSFLEKEPVGRITKGVLFTDMDGARAALYGAYTQVANYYAAEFTIYADLRADHVIDTAIGSRPAMYDDYTYNSRVTDDAGTSGHIWADIYAALNNVNNILESAPSVQTVSQADRVELNQIVGQALILRAFCHFDLCKVYAQHYQRTPDAGHLGVPVLLKTPSPGALVPRNTVKEVYTQVITDLNEAEKILKENPMVRDQTLVSYQAAWGLLSRAYLYMGDWDRSIAYGDSVINKGNYTLTTRANYSNMYFSNTPASEIIWQLYKRVEVLPATANLLLFEVAANAKLKSLFDASDIRRSLMRDRVLENNGVPTTRPRTVTMKYGNVPGSATRVTVDPKVLRLSEIYLNRAEAHWNNKNYTAAAADVRVIAERAHGTTPVTIPSDPAQLYNFICDERSRELCFEGHRLFDLARRKQDINRGADCEAPLCQISYPDYRYILPITQKELDANKAMVGNPDSNN